MTDHNYEDDVFKTVKVVSASQLLKLETLSRQLGFNQNLHPEWLGHIIDHEAPHFLFPELIHSSAGGRKVEPHLRNLLRIKIMPQQHWKKGLLLVSLLDLPVNLVKGLKDISQQQAIWLCQYLSICGPSVADFENTVSSSIQANS